MAKQVLLLTLVLRHLSVVCIHNVKIHLKVKWRISSAAVVAVITLLQQVYLKFLSRGQSTILVAVVSLEKFGELVNKSYNESK